VVSKPETPEALAYSAAFRQKVQGQFREKVTLADLADDCLKSTFAKWTQAEVDALIELCATPAGQSALVKLAPAVRSIEMAAQSRATLFGLETNKLLRPALEALKEMDQKALAAHSTVSAVPPVPVAEKLDAKSAPVPLAPAPVPASSHP
jgi:hypothetical protein